ALRRQRQPRERAGAPGAPRRRWGARGRGEPRGRLGCRDRRVSAMRSERLAPSLALVVLDGWGLAPDGPGNAVSLATTPVFDELWRRYPHTELTAWGEAVGLPAGQMGNSEVGHLNLGAGAIVKQDLLRIDEAVRSGELASNPVLREAMAAQRVHLIGLVSDGGVHSGFGHL